MRVQKNGMTEIEEGTVGQSHGASAEEGEFYLRESSSSCKYKQRLMYIRMVQHLIEKCLIFRMGLRDCVRALAKHAKIHPLVTLTVWKGLVKENKDFFRAYFLQMGSQPFSCSQGNGTSYGSHRFPRQRRITARCELQPQYCPSAHSARLANH